jgi:hypothetical protein
MSYDILYMLYEFGCYNNCVIDYVLLAFCGSLFFTTKICKSIAKTLKCVRPHTCGGHRWGRCQPISRLRATASGPRLTKMWGVGGGGGFGDASCHCIWARPLTAADPEPIQQPKFSLQMCLPDKKRTPTCLGIEALEPLFVPKDSICLFGSPRDAIMYYV